MWAHHSEQETRKVVCDIGDYKNDEDISMEEEEEYPHELVMFHRRTNLNLMF